MQTLRESKHCRSSVSYLFASILIALLKARIVAAEPQLIVTDIERSCEFFCEKLGFALIFTYGRPAYYAHVGRDAARVNLRCVKRTIIESTVSN